MIKKNILPRADDEFSADPGVPTGLSASSGVDPATICGIFAPIGSPGGMSIGGNEAGPFAAISAATLF